MIYVAPITSHGDLAQRLAELRQLEREGCPQAATIDETIRAYHEYNEPMKRIDVDALIERTQRRKALC